MPSLHHFETNCPSEVNFWILLIIHDCHIDIPIVITTHTVWFVELSIVCSFDSPRGEKLSIRCEFLNPIIFIIWNKNTIICSYYHIIKSVKLVFLITFGFSLGNYIIWFGWAISNIATCHTARMHLININQEKKWSQYYQCSSYYNHPFLNNSIFSPYSKLSS